WKGLSPFNKEKTPSFTVNDQKGFYHDFSSGKHGNIFDFLMETEGVTFPEAVERLAQMAGLVLPVVSREAQAREERRKTLHEVVELAAKFFEATLAARGGARGRGYLADRGIAPATQLKFRLGYATAEHYALKEHLGAAKIPVEDMVEAGLLVSGEDIAVPYDRFRDRIMFPILDWRGRVIAFGGRALEKDVSAKYLNSPETPLFHKGGTLYNIGAARAARHRAHRRPTRADVAAQRRADLVLRRRRCRPPRRLSRRRSGAAAAPTGQEPALCHLAGWPGSRRSRSLRRPRCHRRRLGRGAPARSHLMEPRERGRAVRHAGAARRLRGAARFRHCRHHRRDRAPLLPPGFRRPAPPDVCAGRDCDAPARWVRAAAAPRRRPRTAR